LFLLGAFLVGRVRAFATHGGIAITP